MVAMSMSEWNFLGFGGGCYSNKNIQNGVVSIDFSEYVLLIFGQWSVLRGVRVKENGSLST